MDSPPSPPSARASAGAPLYRAAFAVIVVLVILAIAAHGLALSRARAAPPRGRGAAPGPWPGASVAQRAAWDILRLDPCCTPWARFGDAPAGSYLAGAPCHRREGLCSGYSGNMWGGASERENFSPDAPGSCTGRSCAMQKAAAAARLEQGALAVAAGAV